MYFYIRNKEIKFYSVEKNKTENDLIEKTLTPDEELRLSQGQRPVLLDNEIVIEETPFVKEVQSKVLYEDTIKDIENAKTIAELKSLIVKIISKQ